jgi:methylmalonyl-CoA mutase, C-terminal domain
MSSAAVAWPPGEGPRILIGTYALDQHEAGAQYIARLLRDGGAEVIYIGRFNLPEHIAAVAVQEDVDLIGMSCHSWEYVPCTRQLLATLRRCGRDIPVVLGGSVITPDDAAQLELEGVAAVFGPGASPAHILDSIRQITTGSAGIRLALSGSRPPCPVSHLRGPR